MTQEILDLIDDETIFDIPEPRPVSPWPTRIAIIAILAIAGLMWAHQGVPFGWIGRLL